MLKLLFVPLFHDSSIVGRILSVLFRLTRTLMGLFAFGLASVLIVGLAAFWLFLPIGLVLGVGELWGLAIFLSGVGLFLIHVFTRPHLKVWQVKGKNYWSSSWVKKKNLNFLWLLNQYEVKNLLAYLEIDPQKFTNLSFQDEDKIGLTAFELAKKSASPYIGSEHFFVSLIKNTSGIDNFLMQLNLNISDFEEVLNYLEKKKNKWRRVLIWDDDFAVHHLKGVNRGWLGIPTPELDRISEDLTKTAARVGFDRFVGREAIVSEVINILSQENRKNVIIVGPAGTGKSTLLGFLARQILAGDAPSSLATKRLVRFDLTRLLSGINSQGELAERVNNIFEEVKATQNIILAVEEIQALGLGEVGSTLNLYSLMLPYLDSAEFQFLATTEPENYIKTVEKDAAFARLFTKIELPPASVEDTVAILEDKAIGVERKKRLKVSFLAIKKSAEWSSKYLHDRILPDSAIALLEESISEDADGWITSKTIEQSVSHRVNVPVAELESTKKQELLNLEELIHQKLIDQEEAVKAVADTLRRSAAGLREANRPIGSFLFVGPTGVGKTELAKILSEVYFKSGGTFVRFDMSEYQSAESVTQLIGGSVKPGLLTEAVRNKQYALLLLDEFEKADPKILTLFLQVLEDGRLTDSSGRTIDFTNTIIIATSNAASLTIASGLSQGQILADLERKVNDELLQIFKPELINRFDSVVLFKTLSADDLQKIVRLKLKVLQVTLREEGYLVEFDENLVGELAKRGFDPVLGARPLRRLIQDTLEAKLSKMILENKLPKGQVFQLTSDLLV